MIYSSQNISYSNLMMVLLDLVVIIKMYIYRGISIQKKKTTSQQFRFANDMTVVDITYVQYWKQIALNFGHWFL